MQTYTENGTDNLSALLEQAGRDGEVRIRRADGRLFVLKPARKELRKNTKRSGLNVKGINLNISTQEIVEIIREGRERR